MCARTCLLLKGGVHSAICHYDMSAQGQNRVPMYIFNTGTILRSEIAPQMAPVLVIWLSVLVDYLRVLPCCAQDTYSMQVPYHSSTTALVDSTERLNRSQNAYEMSYRNGSGYKVPLDSSQTDWDGYMKGFNKDGDSGLVRKTGLKFNLQAKQ